MADSLRVSRSDDLHLQRADAVDAARSACRRAPTAATPSGVPVKIRSPGASSQAADRCSMISAHAPDQLADACCCWRGCAVDVERDLGVGVDAGTRRRGAIGADRRRLVEALADAPRPAELLRLALQVAARHVEADGVAPDVAPSRRRRRCRARPCRSRRPVRPRGAGSWSGSGSASGRPRLRRPAAPRRPAS